MANEPVVKVYLSVEEHHALTTLARQECRLSSDQLRFLLREAATRRGLLPAEPVKEGQRYESATRRAA